MRIAALVSPGDWAFNFGTSGAVGWRHVLDRCARAGITRVYWRVTVGYSYYASKINNTRPVFLDLASLERMTKRNRWWYYEAVDWSKDDTFAVAVDYGRRLGIEVYAWLTLENAHALGTMTRLAQEHPEMMTVDRSGRRYYRLHGWAFPEVRRWWLEIVRELVAYNPHGILLDLGRMGYATEPEVRGVATAGYEAPMVEAFRQETGRDPFEIPNDDPDWVQFRARPFTDWVGRVHDMLSAQPVPMQLAAMAKAPGTYRVQSRWSETTPLSEQANTGAARDTGAVVAGTPLTDRFADIKTWTTNGWLKLVSLIGHNFPKSDPATWRFTCYENPPPWYKIDVEGGGEAGGRMATAAEIQAVRDHFVELGAAKLELSWCLLPLCFEQGQGPELTRRIRELADYGFDEVNINESNLLMHTDDFRWDAVREAGKATGT